MTDMMRKGEIKLARARKSELLAPRLKGLAAPRLSSNITLPLLRLGAPSLDYLMLCVVQVLFLVLSVLTQRKPKEPQLPPLAFKQVTIGLAILC